MAEKICQCCGSTFSARGAGRHKWCEPCKTRICPYCNEEFTVTPSQAAQRFCSHVCRSADSQSRNDEKFWAKVEKADGCWPWIGSTNYAGYGVFYPKKHRSILAHRRAYAQTYGKLPDDMCVLHHCDNPPCVNPDHLFVGTREDNIMDMVSKGRNKHLRGVHHPHAKLNPNIVRDIRAFYDKGFSYRDIGRMLGLHHSTVARILNKETWQHVD